VTSVWENIEPVEAEGRLRSLRRRLAELDEALQGQQAILRENPESFAFKLACESLLQIQKRLREELVELVRYRRNEQITFALGGSNFADNSASLGNLGVFLIRLQKLYSSIAQAIRTGPTLRGPIAVDIRAATELRLADVYPSSFGMQMFVPSGFDLMGNSISSEALEAMFQLLVSTNNEQKLMRLSGEYGRRTLGHLRHVATTLREVSATLNINWTDYTGTQHNWVSGPDTTALIIEYLDNITETRSEQRQITGRLVGASLLRNRFELLLPDRSLIEGKFVSGLAAAITDAFGAMCAVTVDETEVRDKVSGETKTYYSLKEIERPPSNDV
jgi:hypothetical protein